MADQSDRQPPGDASTPDAMDVAALLDSMSDGCFAVAADWTVTYLNRACEDYVGRPRSEILGRPVWDAHPALCGTECERQLRVAMVERAPRCVEIYSAAHPGHLVELRLFPTRDGLAAILRDVTDERRREATLRESEARFRNMADNAPVMVWVTEPDGRCTYLSRRWYEFTGQMPETALDFGWLDAIHPDDRAETERVFREANQRQEVFCIDYRARRHDGAWRWVIDAAAPRFGDNGAFLGYIGSAIDITERKQAENRLKLLAREVDHRAKNILALVQVMIRQTRAASVDDFIRVATGRLYALGRAHTLLSQGRWTGADLHRLIDEELALFRIGPGGRVHLSGPPVRLGPEAAQSLAMALHELTTNATKHGALSIPQGIVRLEWTGGGHAPLVLRWSESGGPPVREPEHSGVGLDMISRTIGDQLGGGAGFTWRREGIVCDIVVPADKLAPPDG
jgi:PAS domain S-box-containing protein